MMNSARPMKSTTEVVTSDWLESVLGKVDTTKVLKVQKIRFSNGYVGDTEKIKVEIMKSDGRKKLLHFIVKGVENEKASIVSDTGFFSKEIKVYSEVLELLKEIWKENWEPPAPKCYGFRMYDLLVLEDLKVKGFNERNRLEGLTWEESNLAIKLLARWHAATRLLNNKQLIDKVAFRDWPMLRIHAIGTVTIELHFQSLGNYILNNWDSDWHRLANDLLEYISIHKERLSQLQEAITKPSHFNVLLHGDAWTSNFMFKKSSLTGNLSEVRFLDFQLSNWGCYIIDLMYFFYMSLKNEVRESKWKNLLISYQTVLYDSLIELGYDGPIPSEQEVLETAEKWRGFGIYLGILLIPFSFGKEQIKLEHYMMPSMKSHLNAQLEKIYSDNHQMCEDMLRPLKDSDYFSSNFCIENCF